MITCMDWDNSIKYTPMVLRSIWYFILDTQVRVHPINIIMKPVRDLMQEGFIFFNTPETGKVLANRTFYL